MYIFQLFNSHLDLKALGSGTISVCVTSRTPFIFNNWHKCFFYLHKILWGICKQITPLMLYEVTSRLVILKFTDAPLPVVNFIINTVLFKLINFTFCSQIISNHLSHCSDYPYQSGVDTATIAIYAASLNILKPTGYVMHQQV